MLQTQLVDRELPFVQQLVPGLTYALLQGRANYLSVSRLVEEVEDALAEDYLPGGTSVDARHPGALCRSERRRTLEELGYIPQALNGFLQAEGAVWQTIAAVRASQDDGHVPGVDFYSRARANAERADVVVKPCLLLAGFLGDPAADGLCCTRCLRRGAYPRNAATLAQEQRVEERGLRRLLRAMYNPQARTGLVVDCRRHLELPADDPSLQAVVQAVDGAQAALESLATQLHRYVMGRLSSPGPTWSAMACGSASMLARWPRREDQR